MLLKLANDFNSYIKKCNIAFTNFPLTISPPSLIVWPTLNYVYSVVNLKFFYHMYESLKTKRRFGIEHFFHRGL